MDDHRAWAAAARRDRRRNLLGHLNGLTVQGPIEEEVYRCMNHQPLLDAASPHLVCQSGQGTVFDCEISPILCMQCGIHRFHINCGYGRPQHCLCVWCQHNPMNVMPACFTFDQNARALGFPIPAHRP